MNLPNRPRTPPQQPTPRELRLMAALDEYVLGVQGALAAFTVALARVIDRDKLAEELRLQLISFAPDPKSGSHRSKEAVLEAMWKAIAPPAPV